MIRREPAPTLLTVNHHAVTLPAEDLERARDAHRAKLVVVARRDVETVEYVGHGHWLRSVDAALQPRFDVLLPWVGNSSFLLHGGGVERACGREVPLLALTEAVEGFRPELGAIALDRCEA